MCSPLESRKANPIALTLLVSVFFREHNKSLFDHAGTELTEYAGVRIAAARSHAKVVCWDLGPGDALVFEGSANLRANGNTEQLTVIRDRGLHDYHCRWIDDLVKADDGGSDAHT